MNLDELQKKFQKRLKRRYKWHSIHIESSKSQQWVSGNIIKGMHKRSKKAGKMKGSIEYEL